MIDCSFKKKASQTPPLKVLSKGCLTYYKRIPIFILYSMKIKEQTRKLVAGCSKHCFEVVDGTDEVSNHIYGKATLTWFEEIFEEYYYLR